MTSSSDSGRPPSTGIWALGVWGSTAIICAVVLTGGRPAQAGVNAWTSYGPPGATVNALAIDPRRLNAGTARGGVFANDRISACVGDCNGTSAVTIEELLTMLRIALGAADLPACAAGDVNGDGTIAIDEILTAANAALNGCGPSPAENCLTSGGTVTTAMCCPSSRDFPDTCAIDACGCAPDSSHAARVCTCAAGRCFDGSGCVRQ